jgi:hypothetical protein
MTYRINPAFERFPAEANIVGFILSSFGELEFTICMSARAALQMGNSFLKTLYKIRATSSRINTADGLMRPTYEAHGLIKDYDLALTMMRYCLNIRNQYAHCNWADNEKRGLFFADLQTSAKNQNFDHSYKHVDIALLSAQLDHFKTTLQWLRFLDGELAVNQKLLLRHDWSRPPESTLPPLHNPASQHVPPWLTPELQAVHLKRALESEVNRPGIAGGWLV